MLQALTSAGIWFVIVWVPVLVAFGLVALVAAWVVRRSGMLARRRDADITPVA
jgi:hypothetical protein